MAEKKFQLISRDRSPGDLSDISLQGSEDSEDNFDISKEFNPKKIYKLFRNYEGERYLKLKKKILSHSFIFLPLSETTFFLKSTCKVILEVDEVFLSELYLLLF